MDVSKRRKQKNPNSLRTKDHTILWSRIARRRHRYNRMDPDPDPESDPSPPPPLRPIQRDRNNKIKQILTKEDWRKFWVQRLRKLVDAPHLNDKAIADAVDRSRRIFLRQREENRKPHIDPDLPSCFYWDKFKVAEWVETVGLPKAVKDMFLHFGISGRHLITVDANKLIQMGLYELGMIKAVTKAVRELLGLPHTNGLRAIARVPPLETFLKMKVRTGPQSEKFTFKEFCQQQGIEYGPVRKQMVEGYQPIPGCCRVEIKPHSQAEVVWVPVKADKWKDKKGKASLSSESDNSDASSSSDSSFLDEIPTVEELVQNAYLRNSFIPQILNDIVEAVFKKVSENKRNRKVCLKYKQQLANEVVKDHLNKVYSDFGITSSEDKLKFVTIIAEELVEDVIRAKEILEDIENFQKRIKTEISEEDMKNLQQAVAHYVQNIMPVVVSAALKEMEESTNKFHCELNSDNSRYEYSDSESSSMSDQKAERLEPGGRNENIEEEFEVIWDRTFTDEHIPLSESREEIQ